LITIVIALALLIPVAGVSLVFLWSITTAEVMQTDKDIKLPVSEGSTRKKEESKGEYILVVRWKDGNRVFRFMEKDYEEASAVVAELAKLKASVPHCRLIIQADNKLPAVEIQRTMNVLASAGFDSITFSTLK
jgi:biopolymer transport protein ExbD